MSIDVLVTYPLQFFIATIFAQNQMVRNLLSEDKEGITEVYENNGKIYSKIVWLKESDSDKCVRYTDNENPDTILRIRPLLNVVISKDFNYKNNKGKRITFYELKSGKTYTCIMWLTYKNILKDRGCLSIFYQNLSLDKNELKK